jgi:hypothetical protein
LCTATVCCITWSIFKLQKWQTPFWIQQSKEVQFSQMSGRAIAWLHKWCCATIMSMVKIEEIKKAHVYKNDFIQQHLTFKA